jgi:hypothetical protein
MATINKKPTKAHKDKNVIKAHRGMAHIPRQRINRQRPINTQVASLKDRFEGGQTPASARDAMRKAREKLRTRGPIAPRPQPLRTQIEPAVVPIQQPIKRRRPPRISDGPLDGGGRRTITPRKLTSREKRRRDNAFKSQADEMFRRYNKRRQSRPQQVRGLGPLPNNFINPQQSTALTDRFTKQIEAQRKAFNEQNQNRLQMRRSKGGDIKKYATGGLNNGMTKSRTKYGTVDNKKK